MCVGADEQWMRMAIDVARSKGTDPASSPLGSVIVLDGRVIAAERNQTQELPDLPFGPSEIENTVRDLGIDVESALAFAKNTEISINGFSSLGAEAPPRVGQSCRYRLLAYATLPQQGQTRDPMHGYCRRAGPHPATTSVCSVFLFWCNLSSSAMGRRSSSDPPPQRSE